MVLVSEEKRHNYTHTGVQFYGICRVIAGQGLDAEVIWEVTWETVHQRKRKKHPCKAEGKGPS